jgi:hypothetical protein
MDHLLGFGFDIASRRALRDGNHTLSHCHAFRNVCVHTFLALGVSENEALLVASVAPLFSRL